MSNEITAPITIVQNVINAPVTLGVGGGSGGAPSEHAPNHAADGSDPICYQQDTAPTDPKLGQKWLNTTTGRQYEWYDGFWVEVLAGPVLDLSGYAETADLGTAAFSDEEDLPISTATQAALDRKLDGKPRVETIAWYGDSITEQAFFSGTVIPTYAYADGFPVWAKIFTGGKFDDVLSPAGTYEFAQGGANSLTLGTTYLPQVIAASPDLVVMHEGTNDYASGYTSLQTADRIRTHWADIVANGIIPIATTILPVTSSAPKSAWIVATNKLLRDYAARDGVLLCDWTGLLESTPDDGTGVASASVLKDTVHPNQIGACTLGRFLAKFLESKVTLAKDPWAGIVATGSHNVFFHGTSGQPASPWASPEVPSGGTLNSKSIITDPTTGDKWWKLDVTKGAATDAFRLGYDFAAKTTIAGETCFYQVDLEVLSGTLESLILRFSETGGTQSYTFASGSYSLNVGITSADGILTIRTTPFAIGAGTTDYYPNLYFFGDVVLRIRRAAIYKAAN